MNGASANFSIFVSASLLALAGAEQKERRGERTKQISKEITEIFDA